MSVVLTLLSMVSFPSAISNQTIGSNPSDYLTASEAHGFAGVVLIAQGEDVLLRGGYGLATRSPDEAFTPDTAFGIGSLSKQFTAAAIVHLEAKGRLSVDDSINLYFDNVPADKSAITIHQVLTHTAGFRRHHFSSDTLDISRQAALDVILSTPLDYEPGEDFHYTDSGYVLLAALVEQISEQSFQSYLHDHFFEPAGMQHTGFFGDAQWQDTPVAIGYYNGRDMGSPAFWPSPTWALLGAGGIISTVDDLHLWIEALKVGKVLPGEAVDRLFTPHADIAEGLAYGYGWFVEETSFGGLMIWHSGAGNSHNADLRFFPESDSLFIIGSNQIDDFLVTESGHPRFGRFDEMIYSTQTNVDLTYAVLTEDYTVLPSYTSLPGVKVSVLRWVGILAGLIVLALGSVVAVRLRRRRTANDG